MQVYPFQKEKLPCQMTAMQPCFDRENIAMHYDKVYGDAVERLNRLLNQYPQLQGWSLERLISNKLPGVPAWKEAELQNAAGAVHNHNLYFHCLCGTPGQEPQGDLKQVLVNRYGSIKEFKKIFLEASQSLFNCGWVWLNSERNGNVHIAVTNCNKTPSLTSLTPVLCLDMWEHAYYIQYITDSPSYVRNWLDAVDWGAAGRRFDESLSN